MRMSGRIAGREPSVNLADVEPLENHDTVDSEASLLNLALDRKSDNEDKFEHAYSDNDMLQESINTQKSINDTRFLENYVTGFVLNQMQSKAGMRKHGTKEIQALLKEFAQL